MLKQCKPVYRLFSGMLVLLLCTASSAVAQDSARVSLSLDDAAFSTFVQSVEAQTSCRFWYDSTETDSLRITIRVNRMRLSEVLEKVFDGSNLHFAIDTRNQVYITRRFIVRTSLPERLFNPGTATPPLPALSPEEPVAQTRLKSVADNKLYEIGTKGNRDGKTSATLAGYVRDAKSGESIIAASVALDSPSTGVNTDQYGYYSLRIPKGRHTVTISSAGMKDARRQLIVYGDGKLDVELQEAVSSLKNVIVSAERRSNTRSLQMGVSKLTIKSIKQVPVVFGEADVLKVVLSLPGVTSTGEASNGFNVRGGSADQNLILFNDATIYNPSHLFGFFSAFNPDVVKGIELYKSAIPAKYGGRLSSVLDVSLQDGNKKQWTGSAGIGPLTGKLMIQGPLVKEKTSVIAGFRTTYSNWLLNTVPNDAYKNSRAFFDDISLRVTHTINDKNTVYLTGYLSNDRFNLNNDTVYRYGNRNANIKWKHVFSNRSNTVITAGIDQYKYDIRSEASKTNAFKLGFAIQQSYLRADFNYTPNNRHILSYGVNSIYYQLQPGSFTPLNDQSIVTPNTLSRQRGLESALYISDQYALTDNLSLNAGIRYSMFSYIGPQTINSYLPGLPRDTITISGKTNYGSGAFIKTYQAPEIRVSLRYAINDSLSLKLSFNTLQQYVHSLTNTVNISPTDTWKLSDPYIRPQQGKQLSLGLYRNFRNNSIETSVEVYYKQTNHFLDYKNGAQLLMNSHIETDVLSTRGKAYGAELLIRKNEGRLNGWLSYAYSRTFLQANDPDAGETVNKGAWYPASFDKPHNVNFIGNYRFSHRYSLSLNMVYSTGRPITLPIGVFTLGGVNSLLYSERNQYRIPDYFRSDISFNIEGNHRLKQRFHNTWTFGVYNLTARQNPYSVYFVQENGKIRGYQLSIFGTAIPFVTYNIRF
ncbi:MAG: TonB-dependent receptor [Bacteroidota bacterium]|nr:TonB-dependent receptor [Bacteroidota bacterium]